MRLFGRQEMTKDSGQVPSASWRKSTRSWGNSDCLEIGQFPDGAVGVRDSKSRRGPVLTFDMSEWNDFLAGIRTGRVPPL
jgi:hypothetical protein